MLRIRDIMSTEVLTVAPELSVRDAMVLLTTAHISGAPVVRGRRVVGVVSLTDLVELAAQSAGVPSLRPPVEDPDDWADAGEQALADDPSSSFFAELWDDAGADVAERMQHTDGPEWNALEDHCVAEAMNLCITALPPDAPVDRAAAVMRRAGIHRVLVMNDDRLVGVVTTTDIAHAVADQRFTARVYVFGRKSDARGG